MKLGSPPYPAVSSHLASSFARSETFSLHSRSVLRCRTLGQSRPPLAGLVPLMGKASVSNISVPLGFVVVPNALAMARLSVVASLLAILPLSSCWFPPLAPLLPLSALWLAPYCPPSAGTLLLHSGWNPTAHHRRLASPLLSGSARLLPS